MSVRHSGSLESFWTIITFVCIQYISMRFRCLQKRDAISLECVPEENPVPLGKLNLSLVEP